MIKIFKKPCLNKIFYSLDQLMFMKHPRGEIMKEWKGKPFRKKLTGKGCTPAPPMTGGFPYILKRKNGGGSRESLQEIDKSPSSEAVNSVRAAAYPHQRSTLTVFVSYNDHISPSLSPSPVTQIKKLSAPVTAVQCTPP